MSASFRFRPEIGRLVQQLAKEYDASQTAILEIALTKLKLAIDEQRPDFLQLTRVDTYFKNTNDVEKYL